MTSHHRYVSACRIPDDQFIRTIKFSVQSTYGILSIALYIFNITVIRREVRAKRIHRFFFILYVAGAITSSFYFLHHLLLRRFLLLGYFCTEFFCVFHEPSYLLSSYRWATSYFPILLLYIHYLTSLHRVIVLRLGGIGENIWDRFHTPIIISGLFVPIPFTFFVLTTKNYVRPAGTGGLEILYVPHFYVNGSAVSSTLIIAIAAVSFGILTSINAILIARYLTTARQRMNVNDYGIIAFEMLVVLSTLLYAAAQAFVYLSIYVFHNPGGQAGVRAIRQYIIDVFTLAQAWTFAILSKRVRTILMKKFKLPTFENLNKTTSLQRTK